MRVIVLADTHLRGAAERDLPSRLLAELGSADLILHAGDVTTPEALNSFRGFAPLRAVLGNNDVALAGELPERTQFSVEGVEVGMVHNSGSRSGRERRVAALFPSAQIVVYGHSHQPDRSIGVNGQLLFNPGSPTTRRMQPKCSYGVIETRDGLVFEHRIEFLD